MNDKPPAGSLRREPPTRAPRPGKEPRRGRSHGGVRVDFSEGWPAAAARSAPSGSRRDCDPSRAAGAGRGGRGASTAVNAVPKILPVMQDPALIRMSFCTLSRRGLAAAPLVKACPSIAGPPPWPRIGPARAAHRASPDRARCTRQPSSGRAPKPPRTAGHWRRTRARAGKRASAPPRPSPPPPPQGAIEPRGARNVASTKEAEAKRRCLTGARRRGAALEPGNRTAAVWRRMAPARERTIVRSPLRRRRDAARCAARAARSAGDHRLRKAFRSRAASCSASSTVLSPEGAALASCTGGARSRSKCRRKLGRREAPCV